MGKKYLGVVFIILFLGLIGCSTPSVKQNLTNYVNPFIGTTTLWDSTDLGFQPTRRAWGAEAYPGATLPNSMVQVTPVTQWRSGSGYQYEDTVIYAFAHTSKGHWNLCYAPFVGVSGNIDPLNYSSKYTHENESAAPGYYQVYLNKYNVNAEVTSTLRCAFHKYTYKPGADKKLLADLDRSNEHVRNNNIEKEGDFAFSGFQQTGRTFYFYAVTNHKIKDIETVKEKNKKVDVVQFINEDDNDVLEVKIGFSYVSVDNAKMNLRAELLSKNFAQVRSEATSEWEQLLSKIKVSGGSEDDMETFYSTFYRSFLWPILLSDINGEFVDDRGEVVNKGFRYYSNPSFWDDYRNKLILLGMISPDVASDVIKSTINRGEISGFIPTFFHGDHASTFIAGSYLRGIKDFDINKAYNLLLNNAFKEGKGGRPYIKEYINRGWISEMDIENPHLETKAKAAVTKTQEYSYDDYAIALLSKEMGDSVNYKTLMKRSKSYKYLFDPSTKLMRGRLANGDWITPFDPERPYYEYMYREATGWQSSFFAPHDTKGLIALYPNKDVFEAKLDSLFSIPWKGYEACNLTVFIGQYCHGNQPGHSTPYLYYYINKQPKAQKILNKIMNNFYRMGPERLAYAGMDDAGEMSSWYVLNAIGLYTYSPADPEYIITVPKFKNTEFNLGDKPFKIKRIGEGEEILQITYDNKRIDNYFITHEQLQQGNELVISTK